MNTNYPEPDWPADMDHCIADATEVMEPIVLGERAYSVPRDVAAALADARGLSGRLHDELNRKTVAELELRELLKALGSCFNLRSEHWVEWSHGSCSLDCLIGENQAAKFRDGFVSGTKQPEKPQVIYVRERVEPNPIGDIP